MKLKEFLNHNRYQVVTTVLVCSVLVWTYACQPQVASMQSPGIKVNRAELQMELEHFIALAEIRFKDLQKQEQLRQTLYEHTTLWATTGTINPLGVLMSVGALLGLGATTDNVRRRIADKKKPPP